MVVQYYTMLSNSGAILALHRNPSTGLCLTAVLANGPLVNYRRKDCQSDAGVSPQTTTVKTAGPMLGSHPNYHRKDCQSDVGVSP